MFIKHNKNFTIGCFLFLVLIFLVTGLNAQTGSPVSPENRFDPGQRIPVDPKIKVGTLDNGLRYYIRINSRPEKRAELRLAVNAGSMQEDENQRGLAHFIEHMAFNGTTHFAKQELIGFLESIGMRFGPDLNAYTSFDETVYMLKIPTDSPETIKASVQILEDWAHGISFDGEEIEKERGVIIEEWRLGQGAEARMQDRQFPVLFKGSRYAERLPIGKKEVIESFSHEVLRKFYRDWYRPDLMAVVAVGDFDAAAMEKLITEHFSGIKGPQDPRQRKIYPVPDHEETLYAVSADPEITRSSVSVYNKLPLEEEGTVGDYRRQIMEGLFSSMLSQRYAELSQKPDPPFLMAFAGKGRMIRSKDMFMMTAAVEEGAVLKGLEALYAESERALRFGFTEAELERQKKDLLRLLERAYTEREKQDSSLFAAEYIRNFLAGEPIPGITYEYELHKHWLPQIKLSEINRLADSWMTEKNRVITVSAPEKEGLTLPSEEELAAVLSRVKDMDLEPYAEEITEKPLLSRIPISGTVTRTSRREDLGITEWTLSNGIRVILKPTDFQEDEIVFRAFSPGGTSLASDEDFIPASTAVQVISAGGLGDFSAVDLEKKLAGKAAFASPFISDLEEGLRGSASPKDLETMFQLIYLTFTAPRADPAIFDITKTRLKSVIENRRRSPEIVFMETLQSVLGQNHLRNQPMTVEMLDRMNLKKSLDFYRDRFADAGDFTFIFVGAIDLEAIKPLVERYLASLPSLDRKESWRDLGIESPSGVVKKIVKKGLEPKSLVSIVFTGSFDYTAAHRLEIRAACEVLQNRLRKLLREDLSGTYGVGVGPSYSKFPDEKYSISISFGTDPDRVEELTEAVFSEIARMKSEGPSEEELKDFREAEFRDYETNVKKNSWLLVQLAYRYNQGEDPAGLFKLPEMLKSLTSDAVKNAAETYFNIENYVQVTLFPEEKK